MPKALIVYASWTGNTKEIAEMAIEKFGDEIINILEERRSIVNDEATEKCKKFPKEYVYEL